MRVHIIRAAFIIFLLSITRLSWAQVSSISYVNNSGYKWYQKNNVRKCSVRIEHYTDDSLTSEYDGKTQYFDSSGKLLQENLFLSYDTMRTYYHYNGSNACTLIQTCWWNESDSIVQDYDTLGRLNSVLRYYKEAEQKNYQKTRFTFLHYNKNKLTHIWQKDDSRDHSIRINYFYKRNFCLRIEDSIITGKWKNDQIVFLQTKHSQIRYRYNRRSQLRKKTSTSDNNEIEKTRYIYKNGLVRKSISRNRTEHTKTIATYHYSFYDD